MPLCLCAYVPFPIFFVPQNRTATIGLMVSGVSDDSSQPLIAGSSTVSGGVEEARFGVVLSLRQRPEWLLLFIFLTLIVTGTLLLKVPSAVPTGRPISWLDALFTTTSAVCVTGLVVRDTATQWTAYGQAVIGVLMQLGGLGILTVGSVMAMTLSHRLSVGSRAGLGRELHDQSRHRVGSFVRFILIAVLLIELIGALLLMAMWPEEMALQHRFAVSLFHSISAFCNAGFSLRSNSLESYGYTGQVHLIVAPLVVMGGLGFPVLNNLWRVARQRWISRSKGGTHGLRGETPERFSRYTKMVLGTTAVLYVFGVFVLLAAQLQPYTYEYFQQGITANRGQLEPLSLNRVGGMLADASFMSLTSRSAGFHTVPMTELDGASRFVTLTLMMIGASPGGAGGGVTTLVFAILVLTTVAALYGRESANGHAGRIHDSLVRMAVTIAACFIALVTVSTGLLCFSEPYPFEKIVYESVSAASTTGLSLGITADLTAFGKAVIIATMCLGRIGPLALLGALWLGPHVTWSDV